MLEHGMQGTLQLPLRAKTRLLGKLKGHISWSSQRYLGSGRMQDSTNGLSLVVSHYEQEQRDLQIVLLFLNLCN